MKIEKTDISNQLNSEISVIRRSAPFFSSPFHYHPELELVYIQESFGKRIIGNVVEPFEAGDMVFLGPNVPHVWLNDEMYYKGLSTSKAQAIVVYFNKDIFGKRFYELAELTRLNNFLQMAIRGVKITGNTHQIIHDKLISLLEKKNFETIIGLMDILNTLSNSADLVFLNNEAYTPVESTTQSDRLSAVFKYVKEHYQDDITLNTIAKIANVTPQSLCRLFKQRMNKPFIDYLHEVRIAQACKLLMQTELTISEIAYKCGYQTFSNFNHFFKKITQLTPKEYKKNFKASINITPQ